MFQAKLNWLLMVWDALFEMLCLRWFVWDALFEMLCLRCFVWDAVFDLIIFACLVWQNKWHSVFLLLQALFFALFFSSFPFFSKLGKPLCFFSFFSSIFFPPSFPLSFSSFLSLFYLGTLHFFHRSSYGHDGWGLCVDGVGTFSRTLMWANEMYAW